MKLVFSLEFLRVFEIAVLTSGKESILDKHTIHQGLREEEAHCTDDVQQGGNWSEMCPNGHEWTTTIFTTALQTPSRSGPNAFQFFSQHFIIIRQISDFQETCRDKEWEQEDGKA